jgi:hypothetical protein
MRQLSQNVRRGLCGETGTAAALSIGNDCFSMDSSDRVQKPPGETDLEWLGTVGYLVNRGVTRRPGTVGFDRSGEPAASSGRGR